MRLIIISQPFKDVEYVEFWGKCCGIFYALSFIMKVTHKKSSA